MTEEDRVLAALDKDIAAGRILPFPADLQERIRALTEGVEISPDDVIDGDVGL